MNWAVDMCRPGSVRAKLASRRPYVAIDPMTRTVVAITLDRYGRCLLRRTSATFRWKLSNTPKTVGGNAEVSRRCIGSSHHHVTYSRGIKIHRYFSSAEAIQHLHLFPIGGIADNEYAYMQKVFRVCQAMHAIVVRSEYMLMWCRQCYLESMLMCGVAPHF